MLKTLKFSPQEKNLLRPVYSFAKKRKVKLYLVGGILRDKLLGREKAPPDYDFAVKKGAINFGRRLSKEIKAGFVVLDDEHGACRLVKKAGGGFYTLDFTDFRGKELEQDLRRRDFSVNSLALELEKVFGREDLTGELIDACEALDDLRKRVIRHAGPGAFRDDPLRILRAFSFACMLGFVIDKATLELARKEIKRLSKVSFERIRDELFKILESGDAFDFIKALDDFKVIRKIFPEFDAMRGMSQGPYHHLDVWKHTLEALKQFDLAVAGLRKNGELRDYLDEHISSGRSRQALIRLALLLHDVGKPPAMRRRQGKLIFHGHERLGLSPTEEICRRLKLSNDELYALKKMVFCHLRPGYLADHDVLTPRAKFRYFRDAGIEAISILILSLADQRATKGPLTTRQSRLRHERLVSSLIREYFRKAKEKKLPRLVNGNDLIKEFGLAPSPLIGKMLSEIEELQAIGKVRSREEALKAAQALLKEK